jgi:hypothetical protein
MHVFRFENVRWTLWSVSFCVCSVGVRRGLLIQAEELGLSGGLFGDVLHRLRSHSVEDGSGQIG